MGVNRNIQLALGLVIVVTIISVIIIQNSNQNEDLNLLINPQLNTQAPESVKEAEILIENKIKSGEEIVLSNRKIKSNEIESQYQKLNPKIKTELTKIEFANKVVNQELLLEEADKNGISTSNEEVQNYIDTIKKYNYLSDENLEEILKQKKINYEEYFSQIKDSLTVSKLIMDNIDLENLEVSSEEIERIMNDEKEMFSDILEEDEEINQIFKEKFRKQLTAKKTEQAITEYINEIKGSAQIT